MLHIYDQYFDGSDLTLLNSFYIKSKKDKAGWTSPYIVMVARDNSTGEKVRCEIENPEYIYFVAKDPQSITHHYDYIERDKVIPVKCNNGELLKSIAENTGNIEYFYNNIKSRDFGANTKLHTCNTVFLSDMELSDHYRFWFSRRFPNEIKVPPTKAYFDIEVDISEIAGDFPEPGEAPVSAVTYIFGNNIYTYILRDHRNVLVEEFELKYRKGGLDGELFSLIRSTVGGNDRVKHFGLENIKWHALFFDDEKELLHSLFDKVNEDKPDFMLAWNMAFDLPYIIARIEDQFSEKASDYICHPDFYTKECYYYVDERAGQALAERGDYAQISSYTVYLDQMIQFASRRKGQAAYQSNKLNDIGQQVAGVAKLDYHHITRDIGELPFKDFKTYIFYNVVDVIVQVCIEKETGDIDYVYNTTVDTNTRYAKAHRQTVYLNNQRVKIYYNDGFVHGNNINKFKEKPKEKFPGAFVADPNLISDFAKIKINDQPVLLFDNSVDFDFSSLYPSIIREFNLSAPTQIGMIKFNDEALSGAKFIEDIATDDSITFCHKWFNMPNIEEMVHIIKINAPRIQTKKPFMAYTDGILGEVEPDTYTTLNMFRHSDTETQSMFKPKELSKGEIDNGERV